MGASASRVDNEEIARLLARAEVWGHTMRILDLIEKVLELALAVLKNHHDAQEAAKK